MSRFFFLSCCVQHLLRQSWVITKIYFDIYFWMRKPDHNSICVDFVCLLHLSKRMDSLVTFEDGAKWLRLIEWNYVHHIFAICKKQVFLNACFHFLTALRIKFSRLLADDRFLRIQDMISLPPISSIASMDITMQHFVDISPWTQSQKDFLK